MKLAVFGCSYSYGILQKIDYYKGSPNWVRELSYIRSDISITNFAYPGTSTFFSAFLFEKYAKEFDYTIFQITSYPRLTFWPDQFDFKKHMIKYEDNLTQFTDNLYQHVFYCNPASTLQPVDQMIQSNYFNNDKRKKLQFSKKYYEYLPDELLNLQYKSVVDSVCSQANLVFSHQFELPTVLSNRKMLGENKFKQYVMDAGDHFNQAGCKWQANYINDKYLQ